MQSNPAEEWQRLTEHYHAMFDGELEELAIGFADLTETAREVLRNEVKNRGLPMAGEKPAVGATPKPALPRFASSAEPDHADRQANDAERNDDEEPPRAYTWKTPLCECDTTDQALQIQEMLKRAGIDSWVERPGTRWASSVPRVVVAADQLEEALQIAGQPIPQDIIEQSTVKVPEFEPPKCQQCGAEDPVLEAVDPFNTWLCEACGKQWTEPAEGVVGDSN
jgi:hypothetical protein